MATNSDSLYMHVPSSRSGCLVCRLRSKKCIESENGCLACLNLRIECVKKYCSVPSWMENSADGQACRKEIREAINSRRHRTYIAPLPITRAFASRVMTPSTTSSFPSSFSEPLPESSHTPLTPVNLDDDLNYILHFGSGSGILQDFSASSAAHSSSFQSFNSLPDQSHNAFYGSDISSPSASWVSQGDPIETPDDVVLFPYMGTPKVSRTADCQTSNPPFSSSLPPIPSDYPIQPQNNTHALIESMRIYLRGFGYDIVPLNP